MARCGAYFLVVFLSVCGCGVFAVAGTLYWDPSLSGGVALGGSGNWDSSIASWWNGGSDVLWSNTGGDDAVFQGASGAITLNSTTVVRNITISTAHNLALNSSLILTNGSVVTVATGLDVRFTTAGNLSGNSSLTKEGTGTFRFNFGTPVYAGGTIVNAGTMAFDNSGTLPVNGDLTVAAGAVVDIYSTVDLTVGGLSGAGTVQCGTFQDRILTVGGNDASAVFSGMLKDNPNGKKLVFVKTGRGTQTLSGTNTFTGGVSVYGGRLSFSSLTNIGGNAVSVGAGVLCIGGTSITNFSDWPVTWSSTRGCSLEIADAANVFTVTNVFNASLVNNGTFVFNLSISTNYRGAISGAGSVVKTGSGTLTLCASNTYSGRTVISNGTLRLFYNPAPTSLVLGGAATNIVWLDSWDVYGNGSNPVEGASVAVWTNKAGGGSAAEHFTRQTTGGVTYISSGRRAVHFDGTGQLATLTDIKPPVSVFYVGGFTMGQNQRLMGSTSTNFILGYWGNYMNCIYWNGVGMINSGNSVTPPDYMNHIWVGTHNGSSYNGYRVDGGGSEWNYASGSNGSGPGRLALGGGYLGGELSKGDISEVLVYDGVLDDADRISVETYLHNKWFGIPPGYGQGSLPESTSVYMWNGGWLDLGGTTQTVSMLYLNGLCMSPGTYGAAGSGATCIYPNFFAGSGVLRVLNGPTGTLLMIR